MKFKFTIIAILVLLLLGFAYYAISPLFKNVLVDEALPQAEMLPVEETPSDDSPAALQNADLSTEPAEITGTIGHPASGSARIIMTDRKRYLRYENFKTINGPDIFVYLSKDVEAKEFVDLGRVRATEGNVNYEIPDTINPKDYPYALVWCKQFGVLFNSAKLY